MIPYLVLVVLIRLSVAQAGVYRLPVSVDWKDQIQTRATLVRIGFRSQISLTVIPNRGNMLIASPEMEGTNVAILLDDEYGGGPALFHIEDHPSFTQVRFQSVWFIEEILVNYRSISFVRNYSNNADAFILLGLNFRDYAERYCLPGSSLLLPQTDRRVDISLSSSNGGQFHSFEADLGYYADGQRTDAVYSLPYQYYDIILGVITSSGAQMVDPNSGVFSNCFSAVLNQLSPITISSRDHQIARSSIVIQPGDYLVFDPTRDGYCNLKLLAHHLGNQRPFLNTFALRGVNTFISSTGYRLICDSSIV